MTPLENFYDQQPEPIKSCLLALREIILQQDKLITAEWKYGCPFFYYRGKMFCYLWVHKKWKQPYLGIVEGKHIEHPSLIIEKTARMKKMLFKADEDLPLGDIQWILKQALDLYQSGKIKTIH